MTSVPADAEVLTIGELSERSGVPASALRFYERQGLISSERTSGNQRRYNRATLRRVAFIRASQRVGVPLADIGGVLAMLEGAAPTREFWVQASSCWSDILDARIKQLQRMRDLFTECIGCGCLSFEQCELINPGDKLGRNGSGAPRLMPGRAGRLPDGDEDVVVAHLPDRCDTAEASGM
ncbi:redox-sensitive transcriptional activator SoxR [Phytoactinopolyspora limicola]|uniref:redox-sensitive transcriptional activator SoxR n=1 Tax=Phytoactinopolyspora limicola TaxID=2715536 RepID=UPI00140BBF69|nr:redox-sensitive transcriptional activator SoxR [Phytoactinopolyspora limicola]